MAKTRPRKKAKPRKHRVARAVDNVAAAMGAAADARNEAVLRAAELQARLNKAAEDKAQKRHLAQRLYAEIAGHINPLLAEARALGLEVAFMPGATVTGEPVLLARLTEVIR